MFFNAAPREAAAVTPIPLSSAIQPSMTSTPAASAIAVIFFASYRPPHFISLMLMRSTARWDTNCRASLESQQLSSAMIGTELWAVTNFNPSKSKRGTGCSTSSISYSFRRLMSSTASLAFQPWFASRRIFTWSPTASRIARTLARSEAKSTPTLVLITLKPACTCAFACSAMTAGSSMPTVISVSISPESPPRTLYSGRLVLLPMMSWHARSMAAFAVPAYATVRFITV